MKRFLPVLLILALAGCGAETVGTAAVGAASKQQELQQARQMKQDVQNQLDAAALMEKQRLEEAAARP